MRTKLANVIVAIALLVAPVAAKAGDKSPYPVVVGPNYAYGEMGSARSSGDGNQFIGCSIGYDSQASTKLTVVCSAADRLGSYFSCSSAAPEVVQVVAAMTTASYISMTALSNGGLCTTVGVSDYSYLLPMTP